MEVIKVSKEEFEKLSKEVKELSDEDLDKAAGGRGTLCDPICLYINGCCICPEEDL